MGKPYPWKVTPVYEHHIIVKNALVLSYRRLAKLAQVGCGVLLDGKRNQIND